MAPRRRHFKRDMILAGIKDPKLKESFRELRAAAWPERAVPLRFLKRNDRVRLFRAGYIAPVMKGWAFFNEHLRIIDFAKPSPEDFWALVSGYLSHRFWEDYCLAAEASLLRHVAPEVIPGRMAVIMKKRAAQTLILPNGSTVVLYGDGLSFPVRRLCLADGLWVMDLPLALCRLEPQSFRLYPDLIREAFQGLTDMDTENILNIQKEETNRAAARRLAEACRALGKEQTAEKILAGMKSIGLDVIKPGSPWRSSRSFGVY